VDQIQGGGTQFGILSARTDLSSFGFVASAGVRWDVDDHFRLGLSLFTPAVGWGSRSSFARIAVSTGTTAGAVAQDVDNLHASPTEPLRV
jgi:hypothetical protein